MNPLDVMEGFLSVARERMDTKWDNDARSLANTYLHTHPEATAEEVAKFAGTFATELAKMRPRDEPLPAAATPTWQS